jgi:chaperonin GroES
MEKLTPLGDNVIVKPVAEEEKTKSGLIIPDTAKEKPHEGEIIAAGPGKFSKAGQLVPMDVKIGDRVIYAKYTGSEIKVEGETYLIMPESDILAIKASQTVAAKPAAAKVRAKGKNNG